MNIPLPKHAITIVVVDVLKLEESIGGEYGGEYGGGKSVLLTKMTGAGAIGTGSGSLGGITGKGGRIGKGGDTGDGEYGGGGGDTVLLEVVHTCVHGNMTSLILTSCTPHEHRSQSTIS